MAYREYNRNGNIIRDRRKSQRAIPIEIIIVPDAEQDALIAALKARLGDAEYWQWYYKIPVNVQMIRRLFIGEMRTKLAELEAAPAI